MIVFKNIDQYDQKTGEKLNPKRVPDYAICDFTGDRIDEYCNPNSYTVNYNDNDPCFGNGLGEGWIFKLPDPFSYAHHDLLAQCNYIFNIGDSYIEPIMDILKAFNEEEGFDNLFGFDTLLRWSRSRMLKKMIEEKQYHITDFLEDLRDYEE